MGNVPLGSIQPAAPASPAAPAATQTTAPAKLPVPTGTVAVQPPVVSVEPQKPKPFVVKVNHEEIELTEDDARKYAQIGIRAGQLETRRAELAREREAHSAHLKAGQLLEQVAQSDPRAYQVIKDAIAGRYPQAAQAASTGGDDGDDGLTPAPSGYSVPSEVEQRLLRIEAALNQTARSLNQRDSTQRLEAALNSQPYLRANPEAAELARTLVPVIAAGELDGDIETAAVVAAKRAQKLVERHLANERAERESKRETTPVPSVNGGTPFPRLDPSKVTFKDHRSGEGRKMLKEMLGKVRAAVSGPQS